MQTIRLILKVPFHRHPAGTIFELAAQTDISGWDPDERVRDRQSFHDKRIYHLPDGGRGFAVELSASDVEPCPEHVFEGANLRSGEARITLVGTSHVDENRTAETPPCGILQETNVSIQKNPALKSQGFLIELPPFAKVATRMVLRDNLRGEMVLEYELRNYKLTDTQLRWDVSDLHPGFFDLLIEFPDGWFHRIRFIKQFPFLVDVDKISPAPEKPWQPIVNRILQKFTTPEPDPAPEVPDLRNEALNHCLEWGANFNQPIQERMIRQFQISPEEADELDRLAREVRSFVYGLCEQELEGKILESDLHFLTKRQYPWVNGSNFNRMKNVGMYYARR